MSFFITAYMHNGIDHITIKLNGKKDYIELSNLLKIVGLSSSKSRAVSLIESKKVKIDGKLITEKYHIININNNNFYEVGDVPGKYIFISRHSFI